MNEAGPRPNGARWPRPGLPTTIVVVSVVVALVAVSGLLYLLYTRTTGPGQVLRDFIEQVEAQDCQGSHVMLDPEVHIDRQTWCRTLDDLALQVDSEFAVRRVVLEEDVALVQVENPDGSRAVWRLRRHGRSWRVLGPLEGVEFLV